MYPVPNFHRTNWTHPGDVCGPEVGVSRRISLCLLGLFSSQLLKGGKTPTPKISALLRKRPVLLKANFVLTKDQKRPYYGHFCGKMHREGSCSKASKVQMLNLVLGVGVFSLLPKLIVLPKGRLAPVPFLEGPPWNSQSRS